MSADQPLLSNDSVKRIRQYVEMKFSHLPKEKHADIIADAIVKVVEKELPPLEYETKKAITNSIINHVIINEQRSIIISDVLEALEKHPLSDQEAVQYNYWKNSLELEQQANNEQKKDIVEDRIDEQQQNRTYLIDDVAATIKETVKKETVQLRTKSFSKMKKRTLNIVFSLTFVALISLIVVLVPLFDTTKNEPVQAINLVVPEIVVEAPLNLPHNELPSQYQYIDFDKEVIKSYLNTRDSLLVDEPYFSAIYYTAQQFNIHPVLLFSITGQEQGFVPRTHKDAQKIVQNPFNVFYSWQDYNTNIEDTTAIAARTLVNLSKDRPEDVEAIKWINRKYAEDEKWHEGVVWFFNTIINYQKNE